jgi:hypothetical protein
MAHSFHWQAFTKATFTKKGMRGCSSIQQRLRSIHSSANLLRGVRRIIRLDIDAKLYYCWLCLTEIPSQCTPQANAHFIFYYPSIFKIR